jgi:hypothetical protein
VVLITRNLAVTTVGAVAVVTMVVTTVNMVSCTDWIVWN